MRVGKEINISLITGEELNIQVYKNVYKLKLGTDLLLRIEE
jgi:maltose phosphorylase